MFEEFFSISLINITNNNTHLYPLWYLLSDSIIIMGNIIGIFFAFLFIFTIIRLDHPSYTISNLIVCNTCLSIGLTSIIMLINGFYSLKNDLYGNHSLDSFCFIRGIFFNFFYVYMYTSLCLKAFNRLRCIVYYTNPILTSYRCLLIIIFCQWLLSTLIIIIIILTNSIEYNFESHLCLIPLRKTFQFIFMKIIYYISILFISCIYLSILYYVLHLPLLERYRRKHQFALLRRILILLIMLIIPGLFSTFLIIYWNLFGTIPIYSFKISSLLDTIGHTGSIITIFISHTKIRRHYYKKKKISKGKIFQKIQLENCELILIKDRIHSKHHTPYI